MTPQDVFVARMRRHRERQGISLDDIATETRIKRELLEAFEQNDLREWPRGLYARAWIRAYARAIGFDVNETVNEFCRLFPHGDRRMGSTIAEIAAIVSSQSEYQDDFRHISEEDRRRGPDGSSAPVRPPSFRERVVRLARAVRGSLIDKPLLHRPEYRERQ